MKLTTTKIKNLLRILWKFFLVRIVFRTSNEEGSYYRNQFGSIISPLEFRIAWDPQLTERAILLNELISPVTEDPNDYKIVRLGSTGDGGYFVPESYRGCDGGISGGISDNNEFEYRLASEKIPVLQFDHSIIEPPIRDEFLFFRREKLGNEGSSLKQSLSHFEAITGKSLKRGILKLDIEGSEFDFISNANVRELSNFSIIIIEFHFLGNIYLDSYWKKVENSLRLIRRNHKPIVAIGNNSRQFVQLGGIPIFDIVEVTFILNEATVPFYDKNETVSFQVEGRAALRFL